MARYLAACDAGGTMTDVISVVEEGRSVIGKAPTSPRDESTFHREWLGRPLPDSVALGDRTPDRICEWSAQARPR